MGYWGIVPPGDTSACDLDDLGITVKEVEGFGLPPVKHNVFDLPLQPGQQFQDYKVLPRTMVLQAQHYGGTSLSALHQLRRKMAETVRPTSVPGTASPAKLQYTISSSTLEIPVYYSGGMEGRIGRTVEETAAVEVTAYDPLWQKTSITSCDLGVSESGTFRYLAGKVDGVWSNLGAPTVDAISTIFTLAVDKDDTEMVIGGCFLNFGGSAAGDAVVKYDLQAGTFSSLSSGANGAVYCATYSPNDTLVIGGEMTTAGGTSVCRIAQWDGSTFSTYGNGFDDGVRGVSFSPCGVLYAVGYFDSAEGSSACGIAYWDGANWNDLDGGVRDPTSTTIYNIAIRPDARVVVCGDFDTAGCSASTTACNIAEWDGSSWSAFDVGLNARAYAVLVDDDGVVYVGGTFTLADSTTMSYIAKWDGYAWSDVGDGMDDTVWSLKRIQDGGIYAAGEFITAGSTVVNRAAIWNKYQWRPLDMDFPGTPIVYAVTQSGSDTYFGFNTCGTAIHSASTQVTNNGDAETYPIIKVSGSGILQSIANATTGEELLFYLTINTGETITIDLSASGKSIESDWRGNLLGELIPLSDYATFHLAPGDNTITLYVSSSGAETAACINFYERYWGTDGLF